MKKATLVLMLPFFALSCGKGKVGEAVRPDETTGTEALDGKQAKFDCTAVAPAAEPLVVDWADHDRMELGLKLSEGIAVVHYGCDGMKLLKHCKIEGDYKFAGASASTRVIELESADAVAASLPVQGIKFSAEVRGDSKINIATAIIGRFGTIVSTPGKPTGECDGATHYVRSAYVGAFAMATGTKGKAAAAAEVFKISASGSSESSRSALTTDGELPVCESYDPDKAPDTPPGKCRAAIRLELYPIGDGAETPPPPPSDPEKQGLKNSCPAGYVTIAGGGCDRPSSGVAYRCDREKFDECKAQCEKGNADSCYNAAMGPMSVRPTAPNDPNYAKLRQEKAPFYEKACAGGVGLACNMLGMDHFSKNSGMFNVAKGMKYYQRACYELFEAASCMHLSDIYLMGKTGSKDPAKGVALLERTCNLGYASGCNRLAEFYIKGSAVAKIGKNPKKGVEIYKTACDQGKVGYSCLGLWKHLSQQKDPTAAQWKAKGCALEPKSFDCKK